MRPTQPTRKRLLAGLAVFLFMLAVVACAVALLLAGEPAGGAFADRLVKLIPVVLVASGTACWVLFRLDALYVQATLRMAEQLAAALARSDLRVGRYQAPELEQLAKTANQLLRPSAKRTVTMSPSASAQHRASLEEERSRLSALMADLSQSVVVCNLDGRVLLYNQRAKQELSTGPNGEKTELLGLGRSIYAVLDRAVIGYAIARLQQASAAGSTGTQGESSAPPTLSPELPPVVCCVRTCRRS